MTTDSNKLAGGGLKKVLYTLQTAQRSGLRSTAKALTSHNACKTCGLGMGGQLGGMTNELGEFPSVCNKSVQAQSTDLQAPIPNEVFEHSIDDLRELDERELAHLGRLNTPLFKARGADKYQPVSWPEAMSLAAEQFKQAAPEQTFFYSSGRSSNEAGFILQLFARLSGTNNVNNCSYYCHQATTEGLHNSIGGGTSTVELQDLQGTDFIMLLGANPASNHPRFIYQLEACRARGGEVVVINPAKEPGLVRFAMPKSPRSLIAGGSEIASEYLQPKIGSDVALLQAIAKAVVEAGGTADDFLTVHTDNAQPFLQQLADTSWSRLIDACGVGEQEIRRIADKYCRAKHAVFAWGMGLTHHLNGVDNVEEVANLALLRGMIGKPSAGLLPLRGHSNVQGIGTIGVKPVLAEEVLAAMQDKLQVKLPERPGLDTMACLESAASGDMQAALIMGGNLFSATPDSQWAERALAAIPFKMFLTTTLNRGHVYGLNNCAALVLPVHARDEELQATTQESMFNYVRLSDGGIHRLDGPRGECAILVDLAHRVLPFDSDQADSDTKRFDFRHFGTHRNVREAIAATVPGMEALASIDVAKQEFHISGRLLHEPVFSTASGRAHFTLHDLPALRLERDFSLASIRSEGQFNTIIYEDKDSYRGAQTRHCVFMNEQDMQALGLKRGSYVDVTSDTGTLPSLAALPFDLPRGNALAYFPEANVLVSTHTDPRSKTPAFKNIAVSIHPTS